MLYSKVDLGLKTGADAAGNYDPGSGEAFSAGFEEGWETGPFKSSQRLLSQNQFAGLPDMADADLVELAKGWQPEALPLETQKEMIAAAGLAGKMAGDKTWDRETLEAMILARQESEERRFTLEKAGGLAAAAGVAGEIAGGAADPIQALSMFVPVVGEARALAMLGKAGSASGRALVRAGIGAAEGAAGALLTEPLTLAANSLGQQEYGPLQSLMNLAGGAVFGAALRPLGGLLHEAKIRDRWVKPWDIVESSEESRAYVQRNARAYADAMLAANPNLDKKVVENEALANSLLLDVYFRNKSAKENRKLADIYNEWQLDYEASGKIFRGLGKEMEPAKPDAAKAGGASGPVQTGAAPAPLEEWTITRPDGSVASSGELLERNRAALKFFEGANSGESGIVHLIARDIREAAQGPDADPALRDLWAGVEEACGVEPGGVWTKEASAKLAKEVENYFWRGKIVNENLAPAASEIRELLGHAYLEAQACGYAGNPKAEKAIARAFATSPEDYGVNFRKAFLGMLEEEEPPKAPLAAEAPGAEAMGQKDLEELAQAHDERLANAEAGGLDPETAQELRAENLAEAEELADELAGADLFEMYAACLIS